MHAVVHPADVQDRNGGILVMATLFGMYPFLQTGPPMLVIRDRNSPPLSEVRPHLTVEIKRSDRTNRQFEVLPKRWIVERTLAWLNRCRRLAKDWENRNRKALAFCTSPQSGSER